MKPVEIGHFEQYIEEIKKKNLSHSFLKPVKKPVQKPVKKPIIAIVVFELRNRDI